MSKPPEGYVCWEGVVGDRIPKGAMFLSDPDWVETVDAGESCPPEMVGCYYVPTPAPGPVDERASFIRQEAAANRSFMRRFTESDSFAPSGSVGYSRAYRCDCGFKTEDAGKIWDHTAGCENARSLDHPIVLVELGFKGEDDRHE